MAPVKDLKAAAIFRQLFEQEPLIVRAPGRINLIGEHTDYTGGFVLPAAINRYVEVAISKSTDGKIHLFSTQFEEQIEINLDEIAKTTAGAWENCVLGTVAQLIKKQHAIKPFNMVIDSDIPAGAGLSSSAALCVAACTALNELFNLNLAPLNIAQVAQAAEHEYAGVKCGIMNQFASALGKRNNAIRLDCRSLSYEYVPLNLGDYTICLFDSGVRHSLASSEYNIRREQCQQGLEMIRAFHPALSSLREVTHPMLYHCVPDTIIRNRLEYILQENRRVCVAAPMLRAGDMKAFGEKLFESHNGLSTQYQVSCKELDFLVDQLKQHQPVAGARMMGGGFGGCTISLIHKEQLETVINAVSEAYEERFNRLPATYKVETSDGANAIKSPNPQTITL